MVKSLSNLGNRSRMAVALTALAAALAAGLHLGSSASTGTPVSAVAAGSSASNPASRNPYARGPAPTESSVTAVKGPFAISTRTVSRSSVTGFGGGTIYYPKNGSKKYGAIAIVPGYRGAWSTIGWMGPRIASQGFVVIGIETYTGLDVPLARGLELLAALDHLTKKSPVRGRIDTSRLAVAGYSLGGGGALEAAARRPGLKAAVGLTPYNGGKSSWPQIRSPFLIVGGQADVVTEPTANTELYDGLSGVPEKAFLEFKGAPHALPRSPNSDLAKYMISWLKRYVDNDTRYTKFLCPAPAVGTLFSDVRVTCPM